MLVGITQELTRTEEDKTVTSEQVPMWAKELRHNEPQCAIINSISKTKDFGQIKTVRGEQRQTGRKLCTPAKTPTKENCHYVVLAIHLDNCWPMVRSVQSAARSTISERSAEM